MPLPLLRLLSERKFDDARKACDFVLSGESTLADKIWLKRRIAMIERDPSQHEWMYRAIVRRRDRQMVGYISFHHKAPDPDLREHCPYTAELGYTIEPAYRRCGHATESAVGMMHWAHRKHRVETFFVTISPSNTASLKMAQALNFKKTGERIDDIDGLEFTMKLDIAGIPEAFWELTGGKAGQFGVP
ncbi:MAG: GNAT family N-acetyltransferase [Opitutales bacterium]|nr:GNAT family N-acetyltransferase [Opitutales bacterium]